MHDETEHDLSLAVRPGYRWTLALLAWVLGFSTAVGQSVLLFDLCEPGCICCRGRPAHFCLSVLRILVHRRQAAQHVSTLALDVPATLLVGLSFGLPLFLYLRAKHLEADV